VLYLDDNQITDIAPLVANTGLDEGNTVYIRNNPLSEESVSVHIPQLEERGVKVVTESE